MNHHLETIMCDSQDKDTYRASKKVFFGIALIFLGCLFLLERLGYIVSPSVGHFWPFLFCIMGLNKLLFSRYTYQKFHGCLQILMGFWVFACLEQLWGWTFSLTWPMILIALGICYIGSSLFKNKQVNNGSL